MSKVSSMVEALFFDFDGVIIDSTTIKSEAFRLLFCQYNSSIIQKIVDYHQKHGGISRVEKIRFAYDSVLNKPLSEKKLQELAKNYSNLVLDEVVKVRWISGAQSFLDSMVSKIPIFVISGTPQAELRHIIEMRQMTKYFREILGSPIKKTPHIEMLLDKYQLTPENCVFVGDAMTDYDAAKATGLRFVGIQGDNFFPEGTMVLPDCRKLGAAITTIFSHS